MNAGSAAYVAIVILLGYAVLSAIAGPRRAGLWQTLGLSAALGAGGMGLVLFWISLAGAAPSRAVLAAVAAAVLAALAFMIRKRRLIRPIARPADLAAKDLAAIAPALIVAALTIVVAVRAHRSPGVEWDDWAIWGLKAKVLAHEPLSPVPAYFQDLSLSYSHLDYPLLLPFLNAGLYRAAGRADARSAVVLLPFFYATLALVVYAALRWKLDRWRAGAVTALLAGMPAMVRWAGAGIADVPLTLFYAGGIAFAVRWSDERRREDLALAALFAVYTAFTKAEGLPLVVVTAAVLAVLGLRPLRLQALAGAGAFVTGVVLLHLPWIFWSRGLPRTHEDYASKLTLEGIAAKLPRLGHDVLPTMTAQVSAYNAWGGLWALLVAIAALGWRGFARRHVAGLWMLLLLHLAVIALVYVITPWDLRTLFAMSLDRVLLHVTPAAALLIGYHWAEARAEMPRTAGVGSHREEDP
jgi:hypothetical protein